MAKKPDLQQLHNDVHLYHAEAVAATGYLTLPVEEAMPMQASVSLAFGGGHGRTQAENYSHHGIFSYKYAHSEVSGGLSKKKGSRTSLAQTVVEGLNIHNVLTCDRVVSRLVVHRPTDGSEPTIIPFGSTIENLRIGGFKVEPELAIDWFTLNDTYAKLIAFLPGVEKQFQKMRIRPKENEPVPRDHKDCIRCTIVKDWGKLPPGVEQHGHGLWVPEFGMVYIGEMFVTPGWRRIRMVRTVLGCGSEGSFDVGNGSGGGVPYP
jgi:hypothetical protein